MNNLDRGNLIELGRWLYDEKEEPELSQQDAWRPEKPPYELGKEGKPFYVTRDFLKSGHTHIRGKSGSGKSSRLLLSLAKQLINTYTLRWETTAGVKHEVEERDAVIIIDHGGDNAMFHAIKSYVDADPNRDFHFLALDAHHSEKFDPFQSILDGAHRLIRLCTLLQEAFSLEHGLAFGASWYSQRNLLLLLSICERLVARKKSDQEITLRDVDRYLRDPKSVNVRDGEQVAGIFKFLLEYDQLQPERGEKNTINMKKSITNRDVVYAYLPSIAEATTARQIAGLLLHTTVNAAMTLHEDVPESGDERPLPHTHVLIDEFHTLAGASFETLLTGARKFSLSMYCANQTTESLVKKDLDLSSVVRDNCSLRLYQTVTGKRDIDELLTFSRETTRQLKGNRAKESVRYKGKNAFGTESTSEQITTQLSRSEALDISATEGAAFAIVEDGLGHREPIPIYTPHHLSKAQYLKYKSKPLPDTRHLYKRAPKIGSLLSEMPLWKCSHLEAQKPAIHQDRLDRFAELRKQLMAEEQASQ